MPFRPSRRAWCVTAVLAILLLALGVMAAPIFGQRSNLPDELLSLANITKVTLDVNGGALPEEFLEAGVTSEKLTGAITKRLTDAGYQVVDGDARPRLVFTALVLTDASVPDTLGFIVFFDVVEDVRLHRLERDFTLPTSTLSAHGVRSRKLLAEGVMQELDRTLDRFIEWGKLATQNQ